MNLQNRNKLAGTLLLFVMIGLCLGLLYVWTQWSREHALLASFGAFTLTNTVLLGIQITVSNVRTHERLIRVESQMPGAHYTLKTVGGKADG